MYVAAWDSQQEAVDVAPRYLLILGWELDRQSPSFVFLSVKEFDKNCPECGSVEVRTFVADEAVSWIECDSCGHITPA